MSRKRGPIGTQRRRIVAESVAAPERLDIAEASVAEASRDKPGRMLVRLIQAGWSLNGNFYPAEVLKRDGATAWPRGTQAFIDHATSEEDYDRPAGSVKNLAAIQTEDARWDEASKSLVAEVRLIEPWRGPLTDMAKAEAEEGVPVIGMSIRAYVTAEHGERDGRRGNIVASIEQGRSVDFVTRPAAGGAILAVLESLQAGAVDEAATIGAYLESRLHLALTQYADDMYAEGRLTRGERIILSSAIGDGLQAWTGRVETEAPQLFKRARWDDAPETEIAADEADPADEPASEQAPAESAPAGPDPAAPVVEAAPIPVELLAVTETAAVLDRADQALNNSPTPSVTANADGSPSTATTTPVTEGVSTMSGATNEGAPPAAGNPNGTPVDEAVAFITTQRDDAVKRCEALTEALTDARSGERTAKVERDAAVARALLLEGNEAGRLAVDKALAASASIPESMYASIAPRVHNAVRGNVPFTDGKVDAEALEALVTAAINTEAGYAAAVLESQGVGRPSGLGGSDIVGLSEADYEAQIAADFEALGLPTDTAKLAAKGR